MEPGRQAAPKASRALLGDHRAHRVERTPVPHRVAVRFRPRLELEPHLRGVEREGDHLCQGRGGCCDPEGGMQRRRPGPPALPASGHRRRLPAFKFK